MLLNLLMLGAQFFAGTSEQNLIDGYTNKLSAFPGDSIEVYINAEASVKNYPLALHDMSGKEVAKFEMNVFPQIRSNERPYENGYGYKVTKKICVPNLNSGVYLLGNQIPFVIKGRNPSAIIVYPSNTNNAYCNAGGKSLYGFNSSANVSGQKVSFLRPMSLPRHAEAFLRWIHNQPIQGIGYVTDMDLDDYKSIRKCQLLVIIGHSEYWTLRARRNFDQFVAGGKNALILSGNTMWWQVRYNRQMDQLICYRDANTDPIKSAHLKTITWCDPSLDYPITSSTGTDFRNAGYGLKNDHGWDGFKILRQSPLLEGTELAQGDILKCPSDETDGTPIAAIENGVPLPDYQKLGFSKVEIVGYDLVSRAERTGIATWIVFKANAASGTVINTATTDWCSSRGIGSDVNIQRITATMIRKMLSNENVFSEDTTSFH